MGIRYVKKRVQQERKTWIKGVLTAKCRSRKSSDLDPTDFQSHFKLESVFDSILILDTAPGDLDKQQSTYQREYASGKAYRGVDFPESIELRANVNQRFYDLVVHGLRFISKPAVSKISKGTQYSYATYTGEVIGYLVDTIEVEVEVPVEIPEPKKKRRVRRRPPVRIGDGCSTGCLDGIRYFISFAFMIWLVALLVIALGPHILFVIAALLLLYFGLNNANRVINLVEVFRPFLQAVIIIGWVIFVIWAIVSQSNGGRKEYKPPRLDDQDEKYREEVIIDSLDGVKRIDTLIINHREWYDYDGNPYEADLKIRKSVVRAAHGSMDSMPVVLTWTGYKGIYAYMLKEDEKGADGFTYIYEELDRLRDEYGLDSAEFAKMVVSMIQDIPYVLVLPGDCDYTLYNSDFIHDYLRNGRPCAPYVKYGLYTPEEFVSNLKGDCDTRTVALYKILNHYGYDVRILNSDEHQHSILGVNLPELSGKFFVLDNAIYTTWETTSRGAYPGMDFPYLRNQTDWETVIE
ncbi:MAG: exosortase/archaeosortase family protein [Bacteroidia bacterium]|nr:exosortase/archaeosortase family protein [Bacteroidia bacterium]